MKILGKYVPWITLLLCVDGFAALMLWIADVQAFFSLLIVIILASALLFSATAGFLLFQEKKRRRAFVRFLQNPDEYNEERICRLLSASERELIRMTGEVMRKQRDVQNRLSDRVADYEEYVEAWAHEIKTPISLLTFLLDNRGGELPPQVSHKLDYIRNGLQESVSQMLFYARLKSARRDYLFELIDLKECVEEVLQDYAPLLKEKKFNVVNDLPKISVYSDRRGCSYLLRQIISNAVKYGGACDLTNIEADRPRLEIQLKRETVPIQRPEEKRAPEVAPVEMSSAEANGYTLCIRDHGIGVRSGDLPYIFEKGFTGNSGEMRQKATGMGLYLAKQIAADLNLTLEAHSEWGNGFEMRIFFPIVD